MKKTYYRGSQLCALAVLTLDCWVWLTVDARVCSLYRGRFRMHEGNEQKKRKMSQGGCRNERRGRGMLMTLGRGKR
ncbi:MAG: hypothetical protein J3R72DRAFT_433139 [Linnemannia gamsii]|nr:MAG: hypothetical protein J3R72DRAFT_433139 [Linnemannia gamsii]